MRWPWQKRTPPTVTVLEPIDRARGDGFFSTSILPPKRNLDDAGLAAWFRDIGAQAIQRTHANLVPVAGATVAGTAMDGASDAGIGMKAAFNFGYCGVPEAQAAWFGAQSFIGYQMCAVLAQHWLVDKACSMPARDAIRNGYEITVNDGTEVVPAVLDYMRKLDKQFGVKQNAREFVRHSRIYGIRIALFKVDSPDPEYYEKPFNPDGVGPGSYKGISQVDPYWITPELDAVSAGDPSSIHFYEPTYWRISGKRYHRSHLVVIRTNDPPDVLKPTYYYGGIPLTQRIYERIYAAERTANEAPQLALTKRTNVIHVDLAAAAANQAALGERLDLYAFYRDNYGVKIVGTDETMEQFETSLNDLDMAIMTQFQIVAAIAEVPATKLLGTQPRGFNATGEYEEASYHEMLESVQEHDMSPLIERHHLLCIRSYVCPKFGTPVFETAVTWNELDAETSVEAATRRNLESTTAKNYADIGAIDGVDVREKLIADEDSGYSGLSAVMPEGPTPRGVVQPNAPVAAPNTQPGDTPTVAPATTAPPAP